MPKTLEEKRAHNRERMRKWREANPELAREYARNYATKWRENNREHWQETQRTWRLANPEKTRANKKRRRETHLADVLFIKAKSRAKSRGLEFTIEPSDIVIPAVCPVLGIPLQPGEKKMHDNSPSLDRFDSTKGYVKGNVAVISHRANTLKNNATADELEAIARWMREREAPRP